jgi:thiamine pyrophosphate-dependent acetolactate synthase large subunit-like protein
LFKSCLSFALKQAAIVTMAISAQADRCLKSNGEIAETLCIIWLGEGMNNMNELIKGAPRSAVATIDRVPVITAPTAPSVAEGVAQMIELLGVTHAFGVAGGAMAALWGAISNSATTVLNFRHEAGAAFAATEAYFASNRPVVVFTTAGPGIINALTGLFAARDEGAKVLFISACTSAPQRGRWAIQETSSHSLPIGGIFTTGALFNYATTIECAAQLPQTLRRLALGFAQPGGFVAHLSVPTAVQTTLLEAPLPQLAVVPNGVTPSAAVIAKTVALLTEGPFAIWVGFGARGAAAEIRELAERSGAAVMASPRGKGIFPENHPQYIGVTGLGGHTAVLTYMEQPPLRTLVLGTRLGEPTSFWSPMLVPPRGFVHVDIDTQVPGVAYPAVETVAIQAEVKAFLQALLQQLPAHPPAAWSQPSLPNPEVEIVAFEATGAVRPEALMTAIQQTIVDQTDAVVLAESGNSFTWATHWLRFAQANRYRVSTGVGSMGHMVTGVVGLAQVRQGKAVAIVGDGAMLMNNEISTAVKYQIPAVWIVLNDARYNMCHQGMAVLGLTGADALLPTTDFVAIAQGMGATGIRVECEADLPAALAQAMQSTQPFVVDVQIDPSRRAPAKGRNQGLANQGVKYNHSTPKPVSFPMV